MAALEVKLPRRYWVEINRLLSFLQWFEPCGPDLVPDNSILREFIGNSILRDYSPSQPQKSGASVG